MVTAFLLPGKAAGFIDINENEKGQDSEDSYGCNRISVSHTYVNTHMLLHQQQQASVTHLSQSDVLVLCFCV